MICIRPSGRRGLLRVATLAAFAALATLASARDLQGQEPSPAIPAELANALLNLATAPGFEPRYFVGVAPADFPAALLPAPPATVVGGLQGRIHRVAVFADSIARQPLAAYTKQLERAGWSRPLLTGGMGRVHQGGFDSSDGYYPFWCSDSSRVMLTSARRTTTTEYIRVTYESVPPGTCVPSPTPSPTRMMMPRTLTLPTLRPPAGVRQAGGGGGSSGNSINARTRLEDASISHADVLSHYAAQLTAAGWTSFPPTPTTTFAMQALEARGEAGAIWRGMLMVVPSGTSRDVTIMMTGPDPR